MLRSVVVATSFSIAMSAVSPGAAEAQQIQDEASAVSCIALAVAMAPTVQSCATIAACAGAWLIPGAGPIATPACIAGGLGCFAAILTDVYLWQQCKQWVLDFAADRCSEEGGALAYNPVLDQYRCDYDPDLYPGGGGGGDERGPLHPDPNPGSSSWWYWYAGPRVGITYPGCSYHYCCRTNNDGSCAQYCSMPCP